MKCVYVIRWSRRIDGHVESGNIGPCYTDENKASEAMLKDMEDVKKAWEEDEPVKAGVIVGDSGIANHCDIHVDDGTCDYYEWCVDKIDVDEEPVLLEEVKE